MRIEIGIQFTKVYLSLVYNNNNCLYIPKWLSI